MRVALKKIATSSGRLRTNDAISFKKIAEKSLVDAGIMKQPKPEFVQHRYHKRLAVMGTKIYSYGTHVANINHKLKQVKKRGYWSNTTSTHVNYVAYQLDYEIVEPK